MYDSESEIKVITNLDIANCHNFIEKLQLVKKMKDQRTKLENRMLKKTRKQQNIEMKEKLLKEQKRFTKEELGSTKMPKLIKTTWKQGTNPV